jgi:hypothetical protein
MSTNPPDAKVMDPAPVNEYTSYTVPATPFVPLPVYVVGVTVELDTVAVDAVETCASG